MNMACKDHGNLLRKADKLSATKCEHSHLSAEQSTHLWLAHKSQMNLWAFLSDVPWYRQTWTILKMEPNIAAPHTPTLVIHFC